MNDWTDQFKNIIEGVAIIVGGGWALYRFGLFRERFPSMELSNNIHYIGENSNEFLFELSCTVENKGKVRKWLAPFDFDLLYLTNDDIFKTDSLYNDEVRFKSFFEGKSKILLNKKFWVSPDWHIPFVDGEAKKRFHYLVAIPKNFAYLSLYTRFIDFNNKQKAVKEILSIITRSKEEDKQNVDSWNSKSLAEKVEVLSKQKSDFYYSQVTVSTSVTKENSTQQVHR